MELLNIDGKEIRVRGGDLSEKEMAAAVRAKRVAWDIETSGLDWHRERIGTCQIHIPEEAIVIVKVGSETPRRLCLLLGEQKVRKVFHHAMFDLRFMSYHWNVIPQNIACTKIAGKLLNVGNKRKSSLKSLLRRYLGVRLNKAQRVSNWVSEELTTEQLRYAAKDVMYLFPLLRELEVELKKKEIFELAMLCFAHIPTRVQLDICGYQDVYKY